MYLSKPVCWKDLFYSMQYCQSYPIKGSTMYQTSHSDVGNAGSRHYHNTYRNVANVDRERMAFGKIKLELVKVKIGIHARTGVYDMVDGLIGRKYDEQRETPEGAESPSATRW